jgi:hypothetical protein
MLWSHFSATFNNFRRKNGVFLKNQCYDQIFAYSSFVMSQKGHVFGIFWANFFYRLLLRRQLKIVCSLWCIHNKSLGCATENNFHEVSPVLKGKILVPSKSWPVVLLNSGETWCLQKSHRPVEPVYFNRTNNPVFKSTKHAYIGSYVGVQYVFANSPTITIGLRLLDLSFDPELGPLLMFLLLLIAVLYLLNHWIVLLLKLDRYLHQQLVLCPTVPYNTMRLSINPNCFTWGRRTQK